jgi:hypothetical protein
MITVRQAIEKLSKVSDLDKPLTADDTSSMAEEFDLDEVDEQPNRVIIYKKHRPRDRVDFNGDLTTCEHVDEDYGPPEEPDVDDSVNACPECEKPNQFGELCPGCEQEQRNDDANLR